MTAAGYIAPIESLSSIESGDGVDSANAGMEQLQQLLSLCFDNFEVDVDVSLFSFFRLTASR